MRRRDLGVVRVHRGVIALVERGLVHRRGQGRDLRFQILDRLRQQFEFALVLVAELALRRSRRGRDHGRRRDRLGCRRGGGARRFAPGRALAQPVAVAADVIADAAVAFHHQRRRHHAVEEVAIVADQQQRAGILAQQFFQQFQRFHVQVVGRFVHHQQVGRLREQLRQQQAVALAAGQAGDRRARAFGREQEVLQVADGVLLLAVDLDEILAFGHVLQRAPVFAQRRAVLVEIRDLQLGADLDLAGLRLQVAQQQLQQRGLAAAVRADQPDAVAAQDRGGHVLQQHAITERERQVLRLDDLLARRPGLRGFHAHVAGQITALRTFVAHRLEPAHAAFVAGAAGLDALPDPDLLLRQHLVETGVLLRFGIEPFFFAAQVVAPVAGPTGQLATVDLDDPGRQRTQEAAVMGDEDQRTLPRLEEAFEPVDRGDVEMVGRLVQQQQIRRRHQRARQQHAALHAAGQPGEIGVAIQIQLGQRLGDALVQRPAVGVLDLRLHRGQRVGVDLVGVDQMVVIGEELAHLAQTFGDHVEHAAGGTGGHFLLQSRDAHAAFDADLAVVRFVFTREQAQERGFAGAVATDQGDAFAGFDREIDAVEQQGTADAEIDAIQSKDRHGRSLAGRRNRPAG